MNLPVPRIWPVWVHLHDVLWQEVPAGHALSHAPQWLGLETMVVHAPVEAHQSCVELAHVQMPFEQISPV